MNIQKLTEEYIKEHPSIKDNLAKDLINYSKLSRKIAKDKGLEIKKNFDAILIAIRRYFEKIESEGWAEDKIIGILKKSRIEIKNKIVVVVLEKEIFVDNLLSLEKEIKKKDMTFDMVEGASSITIITSQEFLDKIQKSFKNNIIKIIEDLIEITIRSPREIETTYGVIPHLYSLFGERGINIHETMSCWTDTILVIKEEDVGKAMEILKF